MTLIPYYWGILRVWHSAVSMSTFPGSQANHGDLQRPGRLSPTTSFCRRTEEDKKAAGSPTLHAPDQLPREMARLPMAAAFCFLRDGRAVFGGDGTIRGIESGAGWSGVRCRRLALEQRNSTLVRARRWLGASCSAAGDGCRLARPVEECDERKRSYAICESTAVLATSWAMRRLWRVWSERSVVGYALENQAVHRNYSNDHKRFVSPLESIPPSSKLLPARTRRSRHTREPSLTRGSTFYATHPQEWHQIQSRPLPCVTCVSSTISHRTYGHATPMGCVAWTAESQDGILPATHRDILDFPVWLSPFNSPEPPPSAERHNFLWGCGKVSPIAQCLIDK